MGPHVPRRSGHPNLCGGGESNICSHRAARPCGPPFGPALRHGGARAEVVGGFPRAGQRAVTAGTSTKSDGLAVGVGVRRHHPAPRPLRTRVPGVTGAPLDSEHSFEVQLSDMANIRLIRGALDLGGR